MTREAGKSEKRPLITVDEYKGILARDMRETGRDGLSQLVFDRARSLGWLAKRDPTFRKTSATPGFPDLVLVRNTLQKAIDQVTAHRGAHNGRTYGEGRLIVAELKREGSKTTPEQDAWLDAFRAVPFVEVHVWRPSSWLSGEIEEILR